MKKRILALLLAMVIIFGIMPVNAFATGEETPTEPCATDGCIFGANHEGNCSNYVAPTEPCATDGCTFGANHEGNCSNYVAPTEPCTTEDCTFGANHEGNCSNFAACETEGCEYASGHEGSCSNYVERNADEVAAQRVMDLIAAIDEVTLESEAVISAADTTYNQLTDAQKLLVTNAETLEAAKAAFAVLNTPVPVTDADELKANVTVTINNQGTLDVIKKSVTVLDQDNDGALTYHDALVILHQTYGKAYVAEEQALGLFVTTMWDVQTGGSCYFHLNNVPIAFSVGTDTVKDGDYLYATNLADMYGWSDTYSYFGDSYKTAKVGEEFTLTLYGSVKDPSTWETTNVPLHDVTVGTYSGYVGGSFTALGKTTDANGQVILSFDAPGTYIISASGNYTDAYGMECPVMPPVCVVTVEAASETVELDKTELSMTVGDEQMLTATVTPEGTQVTWSSSDEDVAKVESGKVTALKAGTATVTAKSGSKEASCVVTVSAAPAATSLSDLKFTETVSATSSEYELQPAFDPAVKEYTLIVPDEKTVIAIRATLADGQNGEIVACYLSTAKNNPEINAAITPITSADAKGIKLNNFLANNLFSKTLTIKVGGEEAYNITLVRKASIKTLALTYGENTAITLNPSKFNRNTTEYTAVIPMAADVIKVKAQGTRNSNSGGTVTVNGKSADSSPYTVEITPEWSGTNAEIVITASGNADSPDAIPTTYRIYLTREASLEILTPPTKTEYVEGETFDPTGMTLQALYEENSSVVVGPDRFTYPTDPLTADMTQIEVRYDGMTVTQTITVSATYKLEGEGTKEYPYLIKTADDLVYLSGLVADGDSVEGKYFKMVNDITLPADWVPIGTSLEKPFSGNFDGDNHLLTVPEGGLPLIGTPINASLSNLNVFGSKIAGFGVVNGYANDQTKRPAITIDNVTLKYGTQTLKSGFIGGYASGENTVVITNSTVEQGVVIGYSKDQDQIGSFGGEFNGTISNCTSYADVYGKDYVGGIVATKGQSMGDFIISGCQFYGTVTGGNYVGGIVGHGYAGGSDYGITTAPNAPIVTIQNCSCSGTVTGNHYVGGILGAERASAQVWNDGYIQNNSFVGKVSGNSYVGGIIGYVRSLNKYTVISGNYYASDSGATVGIAGVEYVDTNCATHETASGAIYLNTESGTADCPKITGCAWKKAHNRTDDPLGADASKLCYTDTHTDPIALELKTSGTYKNEYTTGDKLDLSGIVLTVVYNDASEKTIALSDTIVTGYDADKVGEQEITISYNGLTALIKVTVKNPAGTIRVIASVLGDSWHDSDADGKVHTLADGNLTTWIGATTYTVDANATVKDVLEKLMKEYGYSWVNSGNYISSVNGLAEFSNGGNSGWMYTLNGSHPNLGVSEQYLKDGDVIVLHYTDDYTKEEGSQGYGDRDEATAEKVEKLIDAIGTVTLNSKDKIDAARNAYDALTYTQKQLVDNYKKLTDAEAKYAQLKAEDDEKKAEAVEDLIDAILPGSTTFEEDVKAAQKAYNNLTADQKTLVDNYYKLVNYQKELADEEDKEAAEAVEDLIDAIGKVTEDSEEKIKAARDAYNKLNEEQKALVDNLVILEAAEKKLAELKDFAVIEDIYKATGDYLEKLGTPVPGTVGGEWMVIGLIRSGREVPDAYYDNAVKFVQENIDENGRLHSAKSTENARMILALTAIGKDVTDVGGHDLLKGLDSMEYIQKQGINGPIWALLAFDSGNYPVPEGDVSRETLIQVILDAQLADGGWALSGTVSDPDITGMVLQALVPYYKTNAEVKAAVEEAVETLSDMQAVDGSFGSIDGKSSESIAQVIIGLAALGIDAHTDARFIKNGVSAIDALCAFFVEGGGFKHIPDGNLDGMATEQAYYALTAYFRMLEGKKFLYDMTDVIDMGGDVTVEEPVETLPAETEPVPTEPVETPAKEGHSFPWWLVIVIVVLAGAIVVLVIISKPKKGRHIK